MSGLRPIHLGNALLIVACHGVEDAHPVVAAQHIHQRIIKRRGVDLLLVQDDPAKLLRVAFAGEKVDHSPAQGVVHHAVQTVAQTVGAQRAVGDLIGCVLPHLAQQHRLLSRPA